MNGYNGWTNWQTWQIPLWIDNEYALYQDKVQFLKRSVNTMYPIDADTVKQFVCDTFAEIGWTSGTPDMDPGDMDKVDWVEIAEHWQDEARELVE